MIIYKVTNLLNGKIYIGQTRQPLQTRWRQHGYKKSNTVGLKGAIDKYGKDNFSLEVLLETDCKKVLNLKEVEYISHFGSLVPNGYNLTTGGEGGYIRSEETRAKLSAAGKGKGRPHTAESKAKLSLSHTGAQNPMFGKNITAEHKAKLSALFKGKPRSQETKDKISATKQRNKAALGT